MRYMLLKSTPHDVASSPRWVEAPARQWRFALSCMPLNPAIQHTAPTQAQLQLGEGEANGEAAGEEEEEANVHSLASAGEWGVGGRVWGVRWLGGGTRRLGEHSLASAGELGVGGGAGRAGVRAAWSVGVVCCTVRGWLAWVGEARRGWWHLYVHHGLVQVGWLGGGTSPWGCAAWKACVRAQVMQD